MAILDLPTGTYVTGVTLLYSSPGQARINYPYTGQIDVISRAPTVMYGTLSTITEVGGERAFLAFAQALNGSAGMFRFPLRPVDQYAPQAHTDNASELQSLKIQAFRSDGFTVLQGVIGSGSVNYVPTINDQINVGHRLVRVTEIATSQRIKYAPQVGEVGDRVEVKEPYVVARLDGQSAWSLSKTGTAGNDVQTVGWVEVVGA